jgi:hypothetical protein
MTRKQKFIGLIIAVICSGSYNSYYYFKNVSKHTRLSEQGIEAPLEMRYYDSNGYGNFQYSFVTNEGKKIEGDRKCGNETGFKRFEGSSVLYNPTNPNEYEFLIDHRNYSHTYQVVIFFFVAFPLMALMFFGLSFVITNLLRLNGNPNEYK